MKTRWDSTDADKGLYKQGKSYGFMRKGKKTALQWTLLLETHPWVKDRLRIADSNILIWTICRYVSIYNAFDLYIDMWVTCVWSICRHVSAMCLIYMSTCECHAFDLYVDMWVPCVWPICRHVSAMRLKHMPSVDATRLTVFIDIGM